MTFQDVNNASASGANASGSANDEISQKPVEVAVFNLESTRSPTDLQMMASQIQRFLHDCGDTNLSNLQPSANAQMVANSFALTGSVLDLILYALNPKQGDLGVQQVAMLSANLIGLIFAPPSEAHVRMALRPMFGLMAECLYREGGQIREGDIKRMSLHLNARIAGDLGKFLLETKGKLGGLLASGSTLGAQILTTLALPKPNISMVLTASTIAAGGGGASADKRDPKEQFTNWASPLASLLSTPSLADLRPKFPTISGVKLQAKATLALTSITGAMQNQAGGQKYTLMWLIDETLKVIDALGEKVSASVPISQTGELERHVKGDILEFVSMQADALSDPPCATLAKDSQPNDSATGHSISYAIGAERVKHTDFYLPKLGFGFSRQYNSQMNEFDESCIGARWMMPFSNRIEATEYGYLFIDSNGRKHRLPASITEQAYDVPFEDFIVAPLENGDIALNFGSDWSFYFHNFNSTQPMHGTYHLIQQHNSKSNEQVDLDYLVVNGQAYLKQIDFKLKTAEQSLKFAYNEQIKIIAVFVDEQVEALARYQYDKQGNLIKATDENGHYRDYQYNNAHQLTRYSDRTGRGQNIRYESTDAKAKAIEEWSDDGSFHTKLKWHPQLRQVAVYDAYDNPIYYYFDLEGFTYRTRLADGRESWYSRDQHKRITRQIDFEGRETQQEYNEDGQLSKIVQPNGGVIRFAYDEQGNLIETKDPEGNIWKREYDADGNISKEINPLGHTTQYKYNAEGQMTDVIDAKGGKKSIQYNELGQMTSYTDCSGKESAWEYDEEGQLKQQQDATAQAVQYIYSDTGIDKGQLKTIIYPDGLKEHFEHDQEGRLLKHIDSAGKATRYSYNQTGLLTQRIDANKDQIAYQWDKQGRIQKLINQNHAEYLFDYNSMGQLIREQAFDGEERHYSYAENGRLFQIRMPSVITQFAYYEDGKIAEKRYTHIETRQTQIETFDYNLNGQLSRTVNENSQIDFYRNEIGQLVREHQHYRIADLKPMTAVIRYDYDELGNLIKTIRPDGHEVAHLSYGSGHVYGIALNQKDMIGFKRDDLHRETERYLANGLIQQNQYNDVGLLISQQIQAEQETIPAIDQSQSAIQPYQAHRHYHYDKNYLLSQVDDSRLGQLNYQYDPIGRLIKTQSPQHTESFSFDPAGNLIDPIATQASQIKNNLVTEYQGKRYRYDAQGNVIETQQGTKTLKLTWDNLNRLIQSDKDGQITSYGYDVFGRRLYKKSQDRKGKDILTLFGWDGDLMVWESRKYETDDSTQDYTKHYIYEPNSFVPALQAGYHQFINLIETPDYSQFKTMLYSIHRDPVWSTETRKNRAELERVVFIHCDQVGTPQSLSNELGGCVWSIRQSTWGKAEEISAKHKDNPFEQTEIRFQGQYYDEETGLHYNRYRYYEPHSARYISKDPIGLNGGLNNSSYVSDPNQWVDPLGLNGEKSDRQRNQEILARQKREREEIAKGYENYNKWAKEYNAKLVNDKNLAILQQEKLKKEKEIKRILDGEKFYRNVVCDNVPSARQPGGLRSKAVLGRNAYRHLCPINNSNFIDYLVCSSSVASVGTS